MKLSLATTLASIVIFNSNAFAEWSEFIPNEKNISALVEVACALDADKSQSASHSDNGVFFHEYQIHRNTKNQFEITGECRISIDRTMKKIAGDKISFIVDPASVTENNKSVLQGYAGAWMFRFHSETKDGAIFDGQNLIIPRVISYISLSISDLGGMSTIPVFGPIIQSAVEVMALSTDYQFSFQKSTIWSDHSSNSKISIDAVMDRTSGSTLERLSLREMSLESHELRIDSAMNYSFGNGIFYQDHAVRRGCTNFTSDNNVHFINEEICHNWWRQLH